MGPSRSLVNRRWQPASYTDEEGELVRALDGTEVTATFNEDSTLTGSAGCNSYQMNFKVDGSRLTINPLITMTLMECSEPEGVMQQERAYLGILGSTAFSEMIERDLVLANGEGERILVFKAGENSRAAS